MKILLLLLIVTVVGWILLKSSFGKRFQERLFRTKTTAASIGEKLEKLNKKIGETDPVCPHCNGPLEFDITHETECPHCGEKIFRRKRPYDQKDILVSEGDLEELKEQWAIVNGEHEKYLKEKRRKSKIAERLKKQTGESPSTEIVELQAMNEQVEELEQKGDWGLARNKRKDIAEYLERKAKYEEALKTYFEICYLDVNGPRNASQNGEPLFSQDLAFVSPGVIKKVAGLIKKLELERKEIESYYLHSAHHIEKRSGKKNLPATPSEAWSKFREMLM